MCSKSAVFIPAGHRIAAGRFMALRQYVGCRADDTLTPRTRDIHS